ncbi:MAG: hypothetical protein IPO72_19480 [Saprospiraceae bacterium]|nr:hypothetical protein [Candidatus Vicinibacter affinis]
MNRHLSLIILIIFTVSFGLMSCSSILTGLYGMKKIKTVDEKTIVRYAKKYSIPTADSYELDTAYLSYLFLLTRLNIDQKLKITTNHCNHFIMTIRDI